MSGLQLSDDGMSKYREFQTRRKFRYVIYRLSSDEREIVVEHAGTEADAAALAARLPADAPRWAVYDFDYEVDGGKRSKILFVSWTPDAAPAKAKKRYGSAKFGLRRSLPGIQVDVDATEPGDLAESALTARVAGS